MSEHRAVLSSAPTSILAVMSPRAWSAPVRELATTTVMTCWSQTGLPSEHLGPILEGVWRASSWSEATGSARQLLQQAPIPRDAYRMARSRKFDTFARLVQPHVTGAVLDVGAGGPDLLERVSADVRVATDIFVADREAPGIRHVVQAVPHALPFDDAAFDAVLMTGMAHHLEAHDRQRLLHDVHRCLRPGGRVVLIEETFSDATGCGVPAEPSMRELSTGFDDLSRDDRFAFLQFTDWWGNRVMKGSDDIPLPMTFLDTEGWDALLADAGFQGIRIERLGLMSGGGHLATPRALIVAARS